MTVNIHIRETRDEIFTIIKDLINHVKRKEGEMGLQLEQLSVKVQEAVAMIGAQAQQIKALSDQVSTLASQASGLNEQLAAVNADNTKLQELADSLTAAIAAAHPPV